MDRRQWLARSTLLGSAVGACWLPGCNGGNSPSKTTPSKQAPQPVAGQVVGRVERNAESAEVLLFDVFGTVVELFDSLANQFRRLGSELGLKADWRELAVRWQAAYLPSLDAVRKGEREFVGLEVLRRESLDRLLPSFGLESLAEADRDRLVRSWARLEPWPDTVAGLTRLKRRFPVVAFSNGGFALLVDMARYAGLPWDAVLSADLFRHFKPDAEVYRGAARLLARPAASLTLVAAHNIDLAAARACGLRTAYLQRTTEDEKPIADWDVIARDFDELADKLGA